MLKHKCAKAWQRNSLWERKYPVDQHRQSWGWRLSSSWGKSGGRWVNFDELPKQKDGDKQRMDPWYSELQSSQELFQRKMAEIRRRVDEDPFKAIFGRKLDRAFADWSPLIWGLAKKVEREVAVVEGSPTNNRPQSKPTEKAEDVSKIARHTVGGSPDQVNQHHAGVPATRPKALAHSEPTVEPNDTKVGKVPPPSSRSTTDDFLVDPITLRKVPRIAQTSTQSAEKPTNIPVKKSEGYRSLRNNTHRSLEVIDAQDALEIELSKYEAPSANVASASIHEQPTDPVAKGLEDYPLWVSNELESLESLQSAETVRVHEGFRSQPHRTETKLPVRDIADNLKIAPRSRSQPPQIESTLSRRLRNSPALKMSINRGETKNLRYDESEATVEDIDLLRASDVRASSGLAGRPRKETDEEKQQRRRKLEDDFNKPEEPETQFAEDIAAQTCAKSREFRSHESPVPEADAFGYDLTPQGLETSYEREMQNRVQNLESSYAAEVEREEAALRDAEVDGFERTPQGLETSFAREQERHIAEGLRLGQAAVQDASLKTSDIDAIRQDPQGLETSLLEDATPSAQTVEPQDGGLPTIEANNLDNTSQIPQSFPIDNTHQPHGEGDMSANVLDFAVRDRWYKQQAPQASQATEETALSTSEKSPEYMRRTEDALKGSQSKRWQDICNMPTQDGSHDAGVEKGLEAYDSKLGGQAYYFQTGQDSLGADILAQSEQQTLGRIGDRKLSPYSSSSTPEGLAMRWEEEEQKLHEELRETKNILSEAKAELSKIMANKETSEPVDVVGQKTSESLESSDQPARPSPVPNAKTSEVGEEISLNKNAITALYKIVANDLRTNEVVTGSATSSIKWADEAPISLPEAISRLTNPAQFLPHFPNLQNDGYELLCGGKEFLVFKKVLSPVSPVTEPTFSDRRRPMNPIDGTTTQTGNFASPTGFVNYDVVLPSSFSEQPSPFPDPVIRRTGPKVRREEDVFSGSSRRWQDDNARPEKPRGRVRKAAKRVLLVGAWTAGCCYVVGVVAEFFRTGGTGSGPGLGLAWRS